MRLRCGLSEIAEVFIGVTAHLRSSETPEATREPDSELAAIADGAVRNGSPVYGGGG
jgi:hypothetical protein